MTTGTAAEYDSELRNMAGNVNVMRRKLERALMAKQQRDWDYAQENGRLDSRRFTAAFAGRTNVFKTRSDSNEIDTALTILVDLSGSMCGTEAYIAQQCAIAMCESIDRTGIRYEVLGFNNRSDFLSNIPHPSRMERMSGKYSRTEPLDMYVFKAFEERLFEAKGAMVTMVHCAGGNNSDGEAIVYAYRRLQARPESRKVMIVMSDGFPASGGIGEHLNQHTRDAVQMATDNGVDCIGIGICSNAVSRFYPKYTVISDLNELASTGMDNLARALMGERFQVDNSKLLDAKKTA
jgi:cobalamin biosynthesis protein CobT